MYEDQLIVRTNATGKSGPYAGKIANVVASAGDDLFVTIGGIDDSVSWGPCRWSTQSGDLPSKGDDALVFFDDNHLPWVALWWPYA